MRDIDISTLVKYRRSKKGVLTNIFQHMKARSKKYGYKLGITLEYLHDRFLTDIKFNSIYNRWKRNGYKYYDKPSIDRKDAFGGYTKDNIQVMTWRQNRTKGDVEVAMKKWKAINCFDLQGNQVAQFQSIKDAVEKLGLHQGLVSAVLLGDRTHTAGYKFEYSTPNF